jgi:hypothetical protein
MRAALCALALGGCAELLDIPEDPVLTGPFSCLGSPIERAPDHEARTARVQIQACNFVSTNCMEPVTGLTAKLCSKKDVNCARPIQADIHDVDGLLSFDVETGGVLGAGFDGYLSISSTVARCNDQKVFGPDARALCDVAPGCASEGGPATCDVPTFAPAMLFFNPPVRADSVTPMTLPLVPTPAVKSITEAAKGRFDPRTGNVFVTVLDCARTPAAGVRLQMTDERENISVVYIADGVISASATETDRSGLGGFMNVPAGFANISGVIRVDADSERVGMRIGNVGLQVAPFTISYATVMPAP